MEGEDRQMKREIVRTKDSHKKGKKGRKKEDNHDVHRHQVDDLIHTGLLPGHAAHRHRLHTHREGGGGGGERKEDTKE